MKMTRGLPTIVAALLGAAQLAGCSALCIRAGASSGASGPSAEHPYRSVDGKRYISGPYGSAKDIAAVVQKIERHSTPRQVSVRGIRLTNVPAFSFIAVYRYTFPQACGAAHFEVIRGGGIEILEYDDPQPGAAPIKIRDYVHGPSPFVAPGLWGPYDSSSNAPAILVPGVARAGGMGLMRGAYAIGWVTTLSPRQQAVLGERYQQAVQHAARCRI